MHNFLSERERELIRLNNEYRDCNRITEIINRMKDKINEHIYNKLRGITMTFVKEYYR